MGERDGTYIPATGYDNLTPLYDPPLRWTLRETTFKQQLIGEAGIESSHSGLDLGCGTGTLALLVKHAQAGARVVGIDADQKVFCNRGGRCSIYNSV